MLPKTFSKGFDKGRLRNLLALIFLALAVPTAVLIWQGYSQLKWEAFHQYRGVAEELTNRIDARLIEMINSADARSFADYTFLVVTGEPSANFVQRSPLSTYPVAADLPGVVGYFQVDSDGAFSTPLLPPPGTAANQLGIGPDEYVSRLQLADEIQAVLADNRLVRSRPEIGRRLAPADDLPTAAFEEEKEADEYAPRVSRARQFGAERESPSSAALARSPGDSLTEGVIGGFMDEASSDKDVANKREAMPLEQAAKLNETYSQQVFDQLNVASEVTQMTSGSDGTLQAGDALGDDAGGKIVPAEQRLNTIGKVSDLKLDAALQKKSQDIERDAVAQQRQDGGRVYAPARAKRREQIALPESAPPADNRPADEPGADSLARTELTTATNLRISTFESEVDPFEFSLLDSGHFVLFRKVWRDGERYIQGLLIDQEIFTQNIIGARFMETALSDMSNLIVAYQDDVMQTLSRSDAYRYANGTEALDGALLYRNRLSAPLDSLELIFSIRRLAPGPGASVLGWVTVVLAIVFVGGFFTLYRLGLSQINLARQQQDFVSAVNHELKTPLTSIRMYGEMLKEGWADEEKRQSYYEFIHDESERLTRLISNVLQLAKITRNEPQFDLKPTPVGGLLSNIESKIASQVERAGFDLTFNRDQAADQATIRIDEDCFAQIIINLVDNAIKFSKDADRKAIEISSLLTSDSQVVFAVRDFGPGIPKDQMKKIFKLFYRSESELTRETVGTGIGLAIVHQLTLAMHGKVDVINQQPGAQFAVSFSACD
jgi:signal transduction histidine kinase